MDLVYCSHQKKQRVWKIFYSKNCQDKFPFRVMIANTIFTSEYRSRWSIDKNTSKPFPLRWFNQPPRNQRLQTVTSARVLTALSTRTVPHCWSSCVISPAVRGEFANTPRTQNVRSLEDVNFNYCRLDGINLAWRIGTDACDLNLSETPGQTPIGVMYFALRLIITGYAEMSRCFYKSSIGRKLSGNLYGFRVNH